MSRGREPLLGVFGSTGAVGSQLLTHLEQEKFPADLLRLFASNRSAGRSIVFGESELPVLPVQQNTIRGIQLAMFAAGAEVSKEWVPQLLEQGATVVDNSSAYRMDPNVPLIVPGVNDDSFEGGKLLPVGNCSAIILASAIAPLHRRFGLKRVTVSTYQSISGAGQAALDELMSQTSKILEGAPPSPEIFLHPCAFNVFSHDSPIGDDGLNVEERKVTEEVRKILSSPSLPVSVTCVRVPVMRAHTMTIIAECDNALPELNELAEVFEKTKGLVVIDDRQSNTFPMPSLSSNTDDIFVGRFRKDAAHANALSFMASGDQLRRGAATTAIDLAKLAGAL